MVKEKEETKELKVRFRAGGLRQRKRNYEAPLIAAKKCCTVKACTEIGLRGGELKIKCNEIKSKTVKERIISSASVKYVIVVKKKGEKAKY